MHQPDDPERDRVNALVTLAQQGDAEAFGLVYDRYVDQIYRYLYYRVGSHALAEDLTSETFLRALRRIDSFTYTGKDIGAWFTTIARNLVTDHVKSSRFKLEVSTADMLDADRAATTASRRRCSSGCGTPPCSTRCAGSSRSSRSASCCGSCRACRVAETRASWAASEGAIKQLQLRAVRALAKLLPENAR